MGHFRHWDLPSRCRQWPEQPSRIQPTPSKFLYMPCIFVSNCPISSSLRLALSLPWAATLRLMTSAKRGTHVSGAEKLRPACGPRAPIHSQGFTWCSPVKAGQGCMKWGPVFRMWLVSWKSREQRCLSEAFLGEPLKIEFVQTSKDFWPHKSLSKWNHPEHVEAWWELGLLTSSRLSRVVFFCFSNWSIVDLQCCVNF